MISPKPLERPPVKYPAKKPTRMTIAIGMLCQGGVVISADTQMTYMDGTTYDAVKVQTLATTTGIYAVAYSSVDASAAESLVDELLLDLKLVEPRSLTGFEETIKNRMTEWSKIFTVKDDRPDVSIITGVRINSNEFGLYLCEPPGTVVRKTFENSAGYVAAGAGQTVTDPIFRTLFGSLVPPRVCLGQLSYLMYRAKKDCRGACGGGTDAVLITAQHDHPLWIDRMYTNVAENHGKTMDEILAQVASGIISRVRSSDEPQLNDFLEIKKLQRIYFGGGPAFRACTGEIIREDADQD